MDQRGLYRGAAGPRTPNSSPHNQTSTCIENLLPANTVLLTRSTWLDRKDAVLLLYTHLYHSRYSAEAARPRAHQVHRQLYHLAELGTTRIHRGLAGRCSGRSVPQVQGLSSPFPTPPTPHPRYTGPGKSPPRSNFSCFCRSPSPSFHPLAARVPASGDPQPILKGLPLPVAKIKGTMTPCPPPIVPSQRKPEPTWVWSPRATGVPPPGNGSGGGVSSLQPSCFLGPPPTRHTWSPPTTTNLHFKENPLHMFPIHLHFNSPWGGRVQDASPLSPLPP